MQTVISETKRKSLFLSIYVHHYTLRAPCPKAQGKSGDQQYVTNYPEPFTSSVRSSRRNYRVAYILEYCKSQGLANIPEKTYARIRLRKSTLADPRL